MPSVPATSKKPWDRPEWFQGRHYVYGICVACGNRDAYPVNELDGLSDGRFYCPKCGSRGPKTPSATAGDEEKELLQKADRLVVWVPALLVKEESAVQQRRRFRFDKDKDSFVLDRRVYGTEPGKEKDRPEGRVRRDKATGKLVPFPKRAG